MGGGRQETGWQQENGRRQAVRPAHSWSSQTCTRTEAAQAKRFLLYRRQATQQVTAKQVSRHTTWGKPKQPPEAASPCTCVGRQRVHAGASFCSAALTGRQLAHTKVGLSPLVCVGSQAGTAHPQAHTMCKHSTHEHSLCCCVPAALAVPLQLSDESLAVHHVCSSEHQQDYMRKHTVMSTQRTTCASHLATWTTGSPALHAQAA